MKRAGVSRCSYMDLETKCFENTGDWLFKLPPSLIIHLSWGSKVRTRVLRCHNKLLSFRHETSEQFACVVNVKVMSKPVR